MDSVSARAGSSELKPPGAASVAPGTTGAPGTSAAIGHPPPAVHNMRTAESQEAHSIIPQREPTTLDEKMASVRKNNLDMSATQTKIDAGLARQKEIPTQIVGIRTELAAKSLETKGSKPNPTDASQVKTDKKSDIATETLKAFETIKNLEAELKGLDPQYKSDQKKLYSLQVNTKKLEREVKTMIESKAEDAIKRGFLGFQGTHGDQAVLSRIKELNPEKFTEIMTQRQHVEAAWKKLAGKDDNQVEAEFHALHTADPKVAGGVFAKLIDANPALGKKIFDRFNVNDANQLFQHIEHLPTERLTTYLPRLAQLEVSRDEIKPGEKAKDATRFRGDDALCKYQNKVLKDEFLPVLNPVIKSFFNHSIKSNSDNPTKLQKLRTEMSKNEAERSTASVKREDADKIIRDPKAKADLKAKAESDKRTADEAYKKADENITSLKKEINAAQPQLALEVLRACCAAIKPDQISPDVKAYLREAVKECKRNGFVGSDRQAAAIVLLRIINPQLVSPKELGLEMGADEMKTGGGIGVILQREVLRTSQRDDLEPFMTSVRPEMQKLFDTLATVLE